MDRIPSASLSMKMPCGLSGAAIVAPRVSDTLPVAGIDSKNVRAVLPILVCFPAGSACAAPWVWNFCGAVLSGIARSVIQGFLPHHWRENTAPLSFADIAYTTIRGQLKCAVGEQFTICLPYRGILPNLPAPKAGNGFDPDRGQCSSSKEASRSDRCR